MARGNRKGESLRISTQSESLKALAKSGLDTWRDPNHIRTPEMFDEETRMLPYEVGVIHELAPGEGWKVIKARTDANPGEVAWPYANWVTAIQQGKTISFSHNHPDWGGSFSTGDFKAMGFYGNRLKRFSAADDVWDYKMEGMDNPEWAAKNTLSLQAHRINYYRPSYASERETLKNAMADWKNGYEKAVLSAVQSIRAGSKAYDAIVQKSVDTVYDRIVARDGGPPRGADKREWWASKMMDPRVRCEVWREVSHFESEAMAARLGLKYTRTLRPGLTTPPPPSTVRTDDEWRAHGKTTKSIVPKDATPQVNYSNPY